MNATIDTITPTQDALLRTHWGARMRERRAAKAYNAGPTSKLESKLVDARVALALTEAAILAELEAESEALGTAFGPFSSAVIANDY
jgi:hypothetical protein